MEQEKKGFWTWVKEHKKELAIAGITVGSIILLAVCNRDSLEACWDSLKKAISAKLADAPKVAAHSSPVIAAEVSVLVSAPVVAEAARMTCDPFEVSNHIRNLPQGWNPSPEKIAEAEALGIDLQPGQTIVDSYTKGRVA